MAKYQPILATLGYVLSEDKNSTLLIHRNARPEDEHFGKYNGLGGKLEPLEEVCQGMKREIFEESGLLCNRMRLRGTINWPGFGKNGEDWFGFIFIIDEFTGTAKTENSEGSLEWVEISRLDSLPMWDGDRFFLPLLFSETPGHFHGVMPYSQGKPLSWNYSWL